MLLMPSLFLSHLADRTTGATREQFYPSCIRCFFMLGACGDTNPMRCVCDDPAVAEAAGRRVGHAAASALEGLLPSGADSRGQLCHRVYVCL